MKILVHGYLEKYSSMGEWVKLGLEALGHSVTGCDRLRTPDNVDDYDLYFVVDSSEDFSNNIPSECKPIKIFWSMDIHMPGGDSRAYNMASKCDLVFSTNYEHGKKVFEPMGIESLLLPITYNDLYIPKRLKKLENRKYDVVMIGHPNSYERVKLWEVLNGSFNCFCGVADNLDDYVEAMSEAKVIVNQPTEPWDIIINNRFFEAMGYGALLLQKPLQTEIMTKTGYKINEHYYLWDSIENLPNILRVHLKDIKDSQRVATNGNRLVKKDSLLSQLSKMESLILDKYWDRL